MILELMKQALVRLERNIHTLHVLLLPGSHGRSKCSTQRPNLGTEAIDLGSHLVHAVHFGHLSADGAGEILLLTMQKMLVNQGHV